MRRGVAAKRSRAGGWARLAGGLSLPVLALAALGARLGIVPAGAIVPALLLGFALALVALALAVYALVGIWRSGDEGAGSAVAGMVYALPALVVLAGIAVAAVIYPPMTDVSTDAEDPPALAGREAVAAELVEAEGAALPGEAYIALAPRLYERPLSAVYAAARGLVRARGWVSAEQLPTASSPADAAAAAAPATGETGEMSIQAVARTLVFGFPEDVVVRMRAASEGTRVDMRSASRAGMHDLGQNARRIRRFLADLDAALQPIPGAASPVAAAAASDSE